MRPTFSRLTARPELCSADATGHKQRGIATVLIMLLVGMSLSVTVLSTAYYIRSTQDQGIAVHAQAQAQMKAWTAAEIVRVYLQQLQAANKLTNFLAQTVPITLSFTGDGATGLMSGRITAIDTAASTVSAEITGITAPGSKAEASSTLQVIYGTTGTTSTQPQQCTAQPKASAVFKGPVTITGGTTSVTSAVGYSDIAVDGSLTISNASEAIISGCAKGNISLSGGGIDSNAVLSSEGTITITSMATPVNATLWAKTITVNQFGGSYNALKAGAYSASVLSAGSVIGATQIGGKLISSTAGTTIPWTTGTIIPWGNGSVIITTTDGSTFLLDLSKASISINQSTGVVTGTSSATRLSGSANLPDSLTFTALSIYGGDLSIQNLTAAQLWGHSVLVQGGSGTYTNVLSNGNFTSNTGTITSLIGGGDLWAKNGGCSSSTNCWNFPTIKTGGAGAIAGKLYYSSLKTLGTTFAGLAVNQVNTSPGLPGVPFCDTRTAAVDANAYKAQANYVFEFVNGVPQLTVKNVSRSSGGASIAGVYSLRSPSSAQTLLTELMTCNYGNNKGCLQSGTTWTFAGVQKFPPGVVWFDGDVTIDGTTVNLLASLIGKGTLNLTGSGHQGLIAPNFSTPALICDGTFYPTNLCDKSTSTSAFVTWTDSDAVVRTGLPIANMAILTEGGLSSSGWTIRGNVTLGQQLGTAGATTQIYGNITVGANVSSTTSITSGGLKVTTTQLTDSQKYLPGSNCASTPTTAASVNLLWSKYR